MASLRLARPRLRNYFKEKYISQVCEVLEPSAPELEEKGIGRDFPEEGLGFGGEREWRFRGAKRKG